MNTLFASLVLLAASASASYFSAVTPGRTAGFAPLAANDRWYPADPSMSHAFPAKAYGAGPSAAAEAAAAEAAAAAGVEIAPGASFIGAGARHALPHVVIDGKSYALKSMVGAEQPLFVQGTNDYADADSPFVSTAGLTAANPLLIRSFAGAPIPTALVDAAESLDAASPQFIRTALSSSPTTLKALIEAAGARSAMNAAAAYPSVAAVARSMFGSANPAAHARVIAVPVNPSSDVSADEYSSFVRSLWAASANAQEDSADDAFFTGAPLRSGFAATPSTHGLWSAAPKAHGSFVGAGSRFAPSHAHLSVPSFLKAFPSMASGVTLMDPSVAGSFARAAAARQFAANLVSDSDSWSGLASPYVADAGLAGIKAASIADIIPAANGYKYLTPTGTSARRLEAIAAGAGYPSAAAAAAAQGVPLIRTHLSHAAIN